MDGGIMPARDVADDGSWKVLRGEDVCFMTEAAKRRIALQRFSSAPWPAFSNVPASSDDALLHRALTGTQARVLPSSGPVPIRRRYLGTAWSDLVLPSYACASLIPHASAAHQFSGSMPSGRWSLVYEGSSYDYVGSLDWSDEGMARRMLGLAGATGFGSRSPDASDIPNRDGVLLADDVRRAFWWMKGAGPLVMTYDVCADYDSNLSASQLAERDVFKCYFSAPGSWTETHNRYKYRWVPSGSSSYYVRESWTDPTVTHDVPSGSRSPTATWRDSDPSSGSTVVWQEAWSHCWQENSIYKGESSYFYQPQSGPVLSRLDSAHGGLSALAGTRCAYMMYVVAVFNWYIRFHASGATLPSPAVTSHFYRAVCPGEVSSDGNVVLDQPVDLTEVISAVLSDSHVSQERSSNPIPGPSSYLDGLGYYRSITPQPFFGYLVFYDEPTDQARHVPRWSWTPGQGGGG